MTKDVLERLDEGLPEGVFRLMFHCPGCGFGHAVTIGPKKNETDQRWEWNGSMTKPTFSPSLKTEWTSPSVQQREANTQFFKVHGRYMTDEEMINEVRNVCHAFVGINGAPPGYIVFLSDSTHALKNQTVQLEPFDW